MMAAAGEQDGQLPGEIPIFPLPRVILLPRVQLPLNIFEPRYLAMTRAAMANGRMIGMIQIRPDSNDGGTVFKTGCAGKIISFNETDDGRYLITLRGVCRFDIGEEMPPHNAGFRRVRPDWSPYAADLVEEESPSGLCRDALMQTLRAYFDKRGLICDQWRGMKDISCEKLISTLSVICPLDTAEKQALLEARTLPDRAHLLQSFLEAELAEPSCPQTHCH